VKNFILLSLLVISQVLGDIWLSRGMKQVGEVNTLNPLALLGVGMQVLANHWIWLGVAFLIASLFFYLTAVSKLDLSYVLPMHAFSHVLNALFAWLLLGESISVIRWAGTFTVTVGVLLVGLSEDKRSTTEKVEKKKQTKNLNLCLLPFGFCLSKTWLAVIVIVLADSAADLLLARGMKQVGEVRILSASQILRLVYRIIINPLIRLGMLCQAIAFAMFISVLSWADISFVRPTTALGYLVSLLGARYILKERFTATRSLGTIFIVIGVAFVSLT